MKVIQGMATLILALMATSALAGLEQPAPVSVDNVNNLASGDMLSARFSRNDTEFIGCGVRKFDDGVNQFTFGFCQAEDAEGDRIFCSTQNADLLDILGSGNDFSFITFSWRLEGPNNDEAVCTRIGFSTQSFYLRKKSGKDKSRKSKK